MKNLIQIFKNNIAFIIILVIIIYVLYSGYQLINPIFSSVNPNIDELKFDKLAEQLKI